MRRNLPSVAIGVVLLYVALTIGAISCFFLHALPSSHHHHDQSPAAHSVLCAWVCEVNPLVAALTVVPQVALFTFVAMLSLAGAVSLSNSFQTLCRSRAPPR
ncbi:MAG: hypothetical protein FJ244_09215 [Nitrospira sp.]|nr:hypothetical protein [Nitrospira sp.]